MNAWCLIDRLNTCRTYLPYHHVYLIIMINIFWLAFVVGTLDIHRFNSDFGPLNLAMLYKFCKFIDIKMQEKDVIIHCTGMDRKTRVNQAFLCAAYSVSLLYLIVSAFPQTTAHVVFILFFFVSFRLSTIDKRQKA